MSREDEIAHKMWRTDFASLSEFGKRTVRLAIDGAKMVEEGVTVDDIDMTRALAVAHAKIARLERENVDLWNENEELRFQLLGESDEDSTNRSG